MTSSGMLSANVTAGVFGLGENLKAKTASYLTSPTSVMVSSKSASVSPGKPTIMSLVMLMSRLAALIQLMRSRYQSRVYSRAMALRTAVEPDWTGRWMWSQRVGVASIASTMSRVKSRGCEVVKRTRRMPGSLADSDEKFGEGEAAGGVAVGVDVLAEELDFGVAEVDHLAGFDEHGGGGAAALLAASVRDDAVGAELVAALDDGDVAAVGIGAGGELGLEGEVGLAVVEAGDALSAGFEASEHVGEVAVGGGAGDQRDVGGLVEDLFALLLGDAAEHGELFAFALELLVVVEAVEDLLFGFVADGAGVVEDEPGVGLVLDAGVALLLQGADDLFGVMGVHLAAEGFDVEGLAHRDSISPGRRG